MIVENAFLELMYWLNVATLSFIVGFLFGSEIIVGFLNGSEK